MHSMISGNGSHMGFPPLLNTVQRCANVCQHMVTMMLGMPDVQSRRMQISLLIDCATICVTLATYLARRTGLAQATASLCAAICEICGKECAKFSDQHSQMCSQVCLHCAQQCQAFAASGE